MILSLRKKDDGSYIGLLRTIEENRRVELPPGSVRAPFFRNLFGLGPSVSNYIKAVSPTLPGFKKVTKPELPGELLEFEEKQTIKGFKFGVMYCAPNQVREDEIFANGIVHSF